jgi:hypothetical protein
MSPQIITQKADGPLDWPPPVDRKARGWRRNRFERLIKAADRTPLDARQWFRVSEIADACARTPGSVELDQNKRARTLELLRQAIYRGDFDDARKRSKVANLHPSIAAELRFARDSAAIADYFPELAEHLWIRRADCKAWFARNGIEFSKAWMRAETASRSSRYPLAERPTQPATAYAYHVLLERWGREGPPCSMSIRQITGDANEHRRSLPANKDYPATPGGLSESTVRRALGLTK